MRAASKYSIPFHSLRTQGNCQTPCCPFHEVQAAAARVNLSNLSQKQVIKEDSEKSAHDSSSQCSSHPRTPTGPSDSHGILGLPRDPRTPTGFADTEETCGPGIWTPGDTRHLLQQRTSGRTSVAILESLFWGVTSRGGNTQQLWLYERGDFTMTFTFYESASVPHSYWVPGN